MKNKKALIILSGGQDSTTVLYMAKQQYEEIHAITFDYGQRHQLEIQSAKIIAEMAGVTSYEVIRVPDCLIGKSFLTDLTAEVETFESFNQMTLHNEYKENKLDSSFVPMRNALFLIIAANRAQVLECQSIMTGVTSADFAEYGGMSWAWIGGFVDADGTFDIVNNNAVRLVIYQKDPDVLARIARFIREQVPDVEYSIRRVAACSELYIGTKSLRLIAEYLMPHIHTPHRRNQALTRGVKNFYEKELCDEYITGFWEGDGSYDSRFVSQPSKKNPDHMTPTARLSFFQKDRTILDRIAAYLGRGAGSIALMNINQKCPVYYLAISDGAYEGKLRQRLRKHFNCIKSFEKLDKALFKLGIFSEGFNPPYPDCTPNFIYSSEKTINEALKSPDQNYIRIEAPLMYLTKSESVHLASLLPGCWDALAHSHTSYDGKYPPTDMNHANVLRAAGFEEAGLADPLVIRAWKEGLMELPTTWNYSNEVVYL